ncbi:MAG: alpha/beta hydrolase [Actinomycetota bacterium]|nr:alpha/beta hydrolase [Actinomycetota bacterium]
MTPDQFFAHRRTITLDRGDVAFVDLGSPSDGSAGEAPPAALFVHGVFLNSWFWHGVAERVADLRRCIVVDLPGHGATPVADHELTLPGLAHLLAELCGKLGLTAVDVVGNDSGGAISQVFAVNHTSLVRSLALTNCDVHSDLPPDAFAAVVEAAHAGALAEAVPPLFATPRSVRLPSVLGMGYQDPAAMSDEDLLPYVEAVGRRAGAAEDIQRFLVGLRADDLVAIEPGLKGLDAPTLLAWGTGDEFFDLKWARWLRDTIPGATEVVEIPDAKLFWPQERPGELADLLRTFWADEAQTAA